MPQSYYVSERVIEKWVPRERRDGRRDERDENHDGRRYERNENRDGRRYERDENRDGRREDRREDRSPRRPRVTEDYRGYPKGTRAIDPRDIFKTSKSPSPSRRTPIPSYEGHPPTVVSSNKGRAPRRRDSQLRTYEPDVFYEKDEREERDLLKEYAQDDRSAMERVRKYVDGTNNAYGRK